MARGWAEAVQKYRITRADMILTWVRQDTGTRLQAGTLPGLVELIWAIVTGQLRLERWIRPAVRVIERDISIRPMPPTPRAIVGGISRGPMSMVEIITPEEMRRRLQES